MLYACVCVWRAWLKKVALRKCLLSEGFCVGCYILPRSSQPNLISLAAARKKYSFPCPYKKKMDCIFLLRWKPFTNVILKQKEINMKWNVKKVKILKAKYVELIIQHTGLEMMLFFQYFVNIILNFRFYLILFCLIY